MSSTESSRVSAFSWAAYLGMSWTWCIGMFLPVLLVRTYGIWAWVIFAIPNMVGAAAMGWVLRDREASERVVAAHQPAVIAFSIITIAFHVFFLIWVTPQMIPYPLAAVSVGMGVLLPLIMRKRSGLDLILAWVVLAISLVVLSRGLTTLQIERKSIGLPQDPGTDLIWLAGVFLFGFALCPYLDITFHRARQSTAPAQGRFAFGIGFGVMFLSMIFLTLLYVSDIVIKGNFGTFGNAGLRTWVATHIAIQAGFTIAVHARALPGWKQTQRGVYPLLILFAAALVAGLAWWCWNTPKYNNMVSGEVGYRIFLSFYGLVFPAYVWICMMPRAGGSVAVPDRRTIIACAIAIILAAPFFWVAFIEGKMIWIVPGLLIVLLARCIRRSQSAEAARL